MILSHQHRAFEILCKQLIGQSVSKIEYAEIDYDKLSDHPFSKPHYFTHFPNIDSIDFSIFFHMKSNDLVEIHWGDEFIQYGIGIKINQPSDFTGFKKWDVSNNDIWSKIMGNSIINLKVNWEEVVVQNKQPEHYIYPQAISLKFSNEERIFISVSEFLREDDKQVHGMNDNLTVTNDEGLARKTKMIN